MLELCTQATLAQRFGEPYATQAAASLAQLLADICASGWGTLNTENDATGGVEVSLAALFLLTLLQGFLGLRQLGGVAETAFYYEELRLDVPVSAVLPPGVLGARVGLREGGDRIVYNVHSG
jgi:hypothetical protein